MNTLRATLCRSSFRLSPNSAPSFARQFSWASVRRAEAREAERSLPTSPSFYTARPLYYDQLMQLKKAISRSQGFLRANHLLPLPEFARASLPPNQTVWKNQEEMTLEFSTKMTTTRYRKVTQLLNELNNYQQIANLAGYHDLGEKINGITSLFESTKKEAFLARGKRKSVVLDEFSRSYTLGKRKTSSARVWVIPTHQPEPVVTPEELLNAPSSEQRIYPVTTTTILVNNLPLNEYFVHPADREKITRPLKVAGVLGKYNVFAIVRGGGTTGQAGALGHGIAKGLVAHEPELETMFRRAKLTRRDPRMVERKKTGMAKARKRYTWVKR